MMKDDFVVLKNYSSRIEADFARDILVAAGISAVIRNLRTPIDDVAQSVDLLVSPKDRTKAAKLLRSAKT